MICTDERQWVPPSGQRWTTPAELAGDGRHCDIWAEEPGLFGLGATPAVGIGQRGLIVTTGEGNLLWDPPGYLDGDAIERVRQLGGLRAVTASHPHFYGAMTEWGQAFGADVWVPEADAAWVTRPDPAIRTWHTRLPVLPGVTLIQCGGHFPGSAVVHWAAGADGAGALLTGDTIVVTPGEDRLTFIWSAPNRLPLPEASVRGILAAVQADPFDRIYAGWAPTIRSGAQAALETSAGRYIQFLRGEALSLSCQRGRVAGDGCPPRAVESPPVSTSAFPATASPGDQAVTAERCAAQLLCGDPAGSADEVARRLLAVQAQDPRGARLAVRARSAGLSASDVDSALARRSMVVSWLNRGTLHLVRAEDYWWLHPLTTPQLRTGNSRRLAQEGVPPQDAERAVAAVRAALSADGPLTRVQLRERVAAAGVRTAGQALVHILLLASIRGLVVRGPVADRDQAFVLASDWLGAPPQAMGREAALGELGRRYLAGHAPAADRDLARWAGIGLRDARLGLARCGAVQRADGLAELPGGPRHAAAVLPPPRLLGAFDPLLLGWVSRDPITGPHRQIITVNGLFRPFALAGGRAVATWTITGGQVVLTPFTVLDPETQAALDTDAADVTRFLG